MSEALMRNDPATPCLALRPREAAAALGVSERTLWDWTQRGDVPHVRRNNTILYPVDALRRWLAEEAGAKTTPEEARPQGGENDPR